MSGLTKEPKTRPLKLLLDTNVVIDFLAVREPFYADARRIMLLGALKEAELWLSSHQVNDVFSVASEGGRKSLGQSCQERIRSLRSFMRICTVQEADIDAALDLYWTDLEDACVCCCAQKIKADFIVTRDSKGFARSPIPPKPPDDLFSWLKEERGLVYEEVFLSR
ncbi:MAG: PIN domain-containing protein [Coriobacteriaceae bacterium]|jgi:predicted nucleic acid-binding protein|nr:PIN domain-containing protein [Coriobacteriaceae bacterium]